MTKEEVAEAARRAIANLNQPKLQLKIAQSHHEKSNIWNIRCQLGHREADISLYLFSNSTKDEIIGLIQERLSGSLKLSSEMSQDQ
jgi:hypothetical protein